MSTTRVNRAVAEFRKITKQRALIDYAEHDLQRMMNSMDTEETSDYIEKTQEIINAVEEAVAQSEEGSNSTSTARQHIAYAANHAGLDRKVKA